MDALPLLQVVGHMVATDGHVEYVLLLQHGALQWVVTRRYSQLRDMHRELAQTLQKPAVSRSTPIKHTTTININITNNNKNSKNNKNRSKNNKNNKNNINTDTESLIFAHIQ